jgi:hypothetical protein
MFRDPDGYPPLTPPWGTLNAIGLNKGEIRRQIPLGATCSGRQCCRRRGTRRLRSM